MMLRLQSLKTWSVDFCFDPIQQNIRCHRCNIVQYPRSILIEVGNTAKQAVRLQPRFNNLSGNIVIMQ
ncbi:hypothetical protein RISW2_20715 [Roseivivax isoporae LMG 25204]|uniref:Uncharacterized protein n=1 Tax=Roseivivax isoporae LMG 25204 TaxID=1449351 RepID=X7F3M5_9RHOB|nr:hypothetical protein RISW2_20715 [Roseivivax isoporae LMG 25204]